MSPVSGPVSSQAATPAADAESARLRAFWTDRYREFSLSESGWLGAGEAQNALVYRCKAHALRRALTELGLAQPSRFTVLDAGCGQGFFAEFYAREFAGCDYTGVDIASRAIEHLRARFPAHRFVAADVSSWRAIAKTAFDVIQCFEVLHLFVDDRSVERTLGNLASQLEPGGVMLVTAALPHRTVQPSHYTRHLSRDAFLAMVTRAGLRVRAVRAMYYWLPDGGPSNRHLRYVMTRLGPRALYLTDRVALAVGVPRWFQGGPDSAMKLLVLERAAAP